MRILTILCVLGLCSASWAQPNIGITPNLNRFNRRLAGTLIDHTANHKVDNRIYSEILCQCRDLYVYLPPGFDPQKQYPVLLYLHGAFGDETSILLTRDLITLDELIVAGCVPPLVLVCPDGTYGGKATLFAQHSFFINGLGGRYTDHIMLEVLPFVHTHYSISPDPRAHAVLGISAGGFGALNMAMKHPEYFGAVATLASPANMRYDNVKDKYFKNFDPETYRWEEEYRPKEVVGRFFGVIRLKASHLLEHAFGPREMMIENVRRENPADLLFLLDLKQDQPKIYLNYPEKDNFNFDAQNESFAWLARMRGLNVVVERDRHARHLAPYFARNVRAAYGWIAQQWKDLPDEQSPWSVASKPLQEDVPYLNASLGNDGEQIEVSPAASTDANPTDGLGRFRLRRLLRRVTRFPVR